MTTSKMEALAMDIYEWCHANEVWMDCTIYYDGKAISYHDTWHGVKGKEIADNLYEYEDKNPLDYFEYANPDTLSMSFEGPLYRILNAYSEDWVWTEQQFIDIFNKHGYYYEMGYAWSLSAYEL